MSLEDSLSPKRQFMSLEYIPVPRVQFMSPESSFISLDSSLCCQHTVYVSRCAVY